MQKKPIPYSRQAIDEEDIEAVAAVLRSDYLTTGPVVEQFEQALSTACGAAHAVACANATTGLHLTALAIGLEGAAAIVPSITFLATANAVRMAGGEVIFADVDPATGLMGADHFETAIKQARKQGLRPKAVFPVHLAGQASDRDEISRIAQVHGIKVIEDAAHSLGAEWNAKSGSWAAIGGDSMADAAVFSFHPVKPITTGEGGAVVTQDRAFSDRVRLLCNHGMQRLPEPAFNSDLAYDPSGTPNPWYYEMAEVGYNYRLTDIQSALGISQLQKLPRYRAAREDLAAHYDELLTQHSPLVRPVRRSVQSRSAWHLYPVLIDFEMARISRASVMTALRSKGIGTQVHYIPVHIQPYYQERYGLIDLPGAMAYYQRTLSLPLFPGLQAEAQQLVVEALADILHA